MRARGVCISTTGARLNGEALRARGKDSGGSENIHRRCMAHGKVYFCPRGKQSERRVRVRWLLPPMPHSSPLYFKAPTHGSLAHSSLSAHTHSLKFINARRQAPLKS